MKTRNNIGPGWGSTRINAKISGRVAVQDRFLFCDLINIEANQNPKNRLAPCIQVEGS